MSFLIGILLLALGAASAAADEAARPAPVVVGAVVSQSGALAGLADGYRKALQLWEEDINAAGGLLGRPVELRLRDDASSAVRAGQLYGELIREGAHLLIGPYGSAATLMAKAQAERAQRVLVNGAGASQAVHARPSRYVFQTAVPNAAYGEAVVAAVVQFGVDNLFLLARDDPGSREMAQAARQAALRQGLKVGELVLYDSGLDEFSAQVRLAQEQGAQAWIAFGGPRDAAEMLRALKKLDYAPPFVFLRDAADPKLIELVGQDAELSLGAEPYAPRFTRPGNAAFVGRFTAKWGAPPGHAAAQGHVAASVLAAAVRRAGSLEQADVRAALADLQMDTVLGGYKVDPESGAQLAASPALVQILRGKPQVVWPPALQSATREPYVPWSERRLLE